MPLRDRDLTATTSVPPGHDEPAAVLADPAPDPAAEPGSGADGRDLRERALEVLLDESLAHVVALVAWREGDLVLVADARGRCALRRDGSSEVLSGADPVADQDPFGGDLSYPQAAERLFGLFDDADRAPDLAVVHTGAHCWVGTGGHPGEHGSLNAVQSRAPLLLSGAGVTARGVLERAARTVDVGATLAHLAGASTDGMDGVPLDLAVPRARHVVGLLWDGAPSDDLLRLAAAGELPAVARLLERGCALRGGAVAAFPSVTLVNHTSALTGLYPGHHGIVNNAYYDRALGQQVVVNSHATWHSAMEHLRPGVRTVWQRLPEGATSACVNEPCDTGADYSTFALIRSGSAGGSTGSLVGSLPDPAQDPHVTAEFAGQQDYAWGTQIDAVGLEQVLGLWREGEPPRLTWWNTTLTDGAAHAGAPGSPMALAALRDADRRLGAWLDLLDERGLTDEVVVLLTADHGMQASDPECTGDWDAALAAAGIPFRDEAHGFLYLGEDVLTEQPATDPA